jgi:hypothetical protein
MILTFWVNITTFSSFVRISTQDEIEMVVFGSQYKWWSEIYYDNFMVPLYFIFPAGTPTVYKHINERPTMTGFDLASELTILRSWDLSLLTCSMLCATQTQCVSFAFSKATGTCSGGRTRFPFPSELTVSVGFKFFVILGLYYNYIFFKNVETRFAWSYDRHGLPR